MFVRLLVFFSFISLAAIACGSGTVAPTSAQTPPQQIQIPTFIPPTAPSTPLPPTAAPVPPPGTIEFKNPAKYEVEYVATVYDKGFNLDKLDFYQPRPIEWDGQKSINVEQVSPDPTAQGVDPVYGNGIYYWEMTDSLKPGDSQQFVIRFTYTASEISTQVDPAKVSPYNQDDPLYKLYTRPERYIESDDPQIVDLANHIAAGETNPYILARKFYDYVIANAHYHVLGKGLLGAKALLTSGEGECGDYSALFIALARARGIPARPVVGYWAVSGIDQTHVWAEFYLEGLGWIPVDPTIGQHSLKDQEYYFGNMDNKRVILNKGFNIQLNPPGPDNYIAPFLQVPLWWYWGSSGDADTVSMERTKWNVTSNP